MATTSRLEKAVETIKEVTNLLSKPMPDTGPNLIKHLTRIDAWLALCLTEAAVFKGYYRVAKDNKMRVAGESLEGCAEAIKRRISLGQSILNYLMAEMREGMKG